MQAINIMHSISRGCAISDFLRSDGSVTREIGERYTGPSEDRVKDEIEADTETSNM